MLLAELILLIVLLILAVPVLLLSVWRWLDGMLGLFISSLIFKSILYMGGPDFFSPPADSCGDVLVVVVLLLRLMVMMLLVIFLLPNI